MPFYQKSISFAILILSISSLSCSGELKENEPENNKRENALELKSQQKVKGTYFSQKETDKDFYFIRADKVQVVSGKLKGIKGIDSKISLYRKGEKKPFKVINDARSSLEEVFGPIKIEAPGVIVKVEPSRKISNPSYEDLYYELELNMFSPSIPIEVEPNEDFNSATEIKENSITGYYSNSLTSSRKIERDFFSKTIKEEKKVRLKFSLTGVASIDPILRIYNQNKKLIKQIDELGFGQGEELSSLGVVAPAKLYIRVMAKDGKVNLLDYYELKIEQSDHKADYEFEPNDTMKRATLLSEDKTSADVSDKNDIDFFLIANDKPWPVNLMVYVQPEEGLDLKLQLFSFANKRIQTYDDSKKEEVEGISNYYLGLKQKVYLKVSPMHFFSATAIPYQIQLQKEQLVEFREIEPNNTAGSANEITPSSTYMGFINPNQDLDYYKLKLDEANNYKLMLEGVKGCVLQLAVTDKKGYIISTRKSSKKGNGISLRHKMIPGNLIRLKCIRSAKSLFKSPYSLTVKLAE